MNKLKTKKGITLVALIVTIIVLLILAGIGIGMLTGDNSIIKQAGNAKEDAIVEGEKEAISQAYIKVEGISKYGDVTSDDLENRLQKDGYNVTTSTSENGIIVIFTDTKHAYIVGTDGNATALPAADTSMENPTTYGPNAQATSDGAGKYFPKPTGATYVEGTVDTGVVIQYKGSEFVWVPVPDPIYDSSKDSLIPKYDYHANVILGGDYTPMVVNIKEGEQQNGIFSSTGEYRGIAYFYRDFGFTSNGSVYVWEDMNDFINNQRTTLHGDPGVDETENGGDWCTESGKGLDLIRTLVDGYANKSNDEIKTMWINEMKTYSNKMVESVSKYGGFYIARYESSINGNTVASVRNAHPATAESTSANTWYGLYNRQKRFSPESEGNSMVSSMITGSQYCAMLNWALKGEDAKKVILGWDENALHGDWEKTANDIFTGVTTETDSLTDKIDRINNIYDLEGNVHEWLLWASIIHPRMFMGGSYGFGGSPSTQDFGSYMANSYENSADLGKFFGSRMSLYIK